MFHGPPGTREGKSRDDPETRETLYEKKRGGYMTVSELSPGFQFIADSQAVAVIREHLGGPATESDSFFVTVSAPGGPSTELWGMLGIPPWSHRNLHGIVLPPSCPTNARASNASHGP